MGPTSNATAPHHATGYPAAGATLQQVLERATAAAQAQETTAWPSPEDDRATTNQITIYTLEDPRTGEVRYVGKTQSGLLYRLRDHIKEKGNLHKNNWIRSLLRAGVKPVIQALEVLPCDNDDGWQEAERFWIETLRFYGCRLTNMDSGGRLGRRMGVDARAKIRASKLNMSQETKNKISQSLTGQKHDPNRVQKLKDSHASRTPEEKSESSRKMSEAQKRRWETNRELMLEIRRKQVRVWTPEARDAISMAHKGKTRSPESIAKMVSAQRGMKRTPEVKAKIKAAAQRRAADPVWRKNHSLVMTGKTHTAETRAAMSQRMRLRMSNPANKAALVHKLTGQKRSNEACDKFSAFAKTRKRDPITKAFV